MAVKVTIIPHLPALARSSVRSAAAGYTVFDTADGKLVPMALVTMARRNRKVTPLVNPGIVIEEHGRRRWRRGRETRDCRVKAVMGRRLRMRAENVTVAWC